MANGDPAPDSVLAGELEADGFERATTIGRGGFGVVFRCLQRSLDRTVAVKVLTAELNADNLERFWREQRAMGRLSGHPNIVNIHHYGTTRSGRPYLVMQYHSKGSLKEWIHDRGPLEWYEALPLGVKISAALETAHRLGTLHRDVKPANILITDYDEPQLADFGIAHIAGGFETSENLITGSPAYTAPEVLRGEPPSPASDVYSLGATLFCAITGHAAFERREGEKIVTQFIRITTQRVPDLRGSGIPDDVSAAIERAMATAPEDRPATAAEFGEQLSQAEHGHDLPPTDLALPTPPGSVPVADRPGTGAQRDVSGTMSYSRGRRRHIHLTPPTKYWPPSANRPLVTRERLVEALRNGHGRHLTLIHSPAGYGKTTLATQWRDILTAEGVPVAWLSVDPDDDNVVWFLSHLVEAVRQVQPSVTQGLGQILEEHGDEAERYVVSSLVNEIHSSEHTMAVIIDDWHEVTSKKTQDAMAFLLDNCCHHLQIIITSRTRSGLPLSRMRVRDELLEIDAEDLRFDADESRKFLVELGGLTLAQRDVRELVESTDGWVAALQLVSLSLRASREPNQILGGLGGRHAIGEFLVENVLDSLSSDLLDFLVTTSLTGRICGSLASVLAGVPDAQAVLEEVERRDLFLRRLDDEGEWFRYHHLFSEFLRRRLERDHPNRAAELHRKASHWFAERHLLNEAVDHALAAGDEQDAVTLVEHDQTRLLEHSQMSTLLGLIAKLPPLLVEESAPLQLAIAWSNILLLRQAPGRLALTCILPALQGSALPGEERDRIRIESLVAEAALDIHEDRTDRLADLVEEALEKPGLLRPWTVSVAANIKTFAEINRFNFDAVPELQTWARSYHSRTNGPLSVMYGYAYAGLAAYEQLDLADADFHFTRALQVSRSGGGVHSFAARLAGDLLGQLRYEQGNLDEAEELIDESYQLGSEGGHVDFMIARYVFGARIKAQRGQFDIAEQRLCEGARTAEKFGLGRLQARIENERILLHMSPLSATVPMQSVARRGEGRVALTTRQLKDDTAIRLIMMQGSADDKFAALERAQQWVDGLSRSRRRLALLQATRLLVSCLYTMGELDKAMVVLAGAASTCAAEGMHQYLQDGGAEIRDLLRELHGPPTLTL